MGSSINRGILQRIGALGAPVAVAKAAVQDILAGVLDSVFITPFAMRLAMKAQTLVDAPSIPWDMNKGFRAKLTLTANSHKLANPTNLQEGTTGSLQIFPGSFTLAASSSGYDTAYDFGALGYPTLITGSGKRNMIFFEVVDATTPVMRCTFSAPA